MAQNEIYKGMLLDIDKLLKLYLMFPVTAELFFRLFDVSRHT